MHLRLLYCVLHITFECGMYVKLFVFVLCMFIFCVFVFFFCFFFFSSRRRHTRWTGDWSSDVCSSDLEIWAFGRRNPFLPCAGLDSWSLPALRLRKPNWYWHAVDLLERLGLGRQR